MEMTWNMKKNEKEFVIWKLTDVVTSMFSISANSVIRNMRTKNRLYFMVSGRIRRFLVFLTGLSSLKSL
jgi:hypothetical protein